MKIAVPWDSKVTTNLKPYPSYKPSGVEWLGEVPAHWEVRRLKWVASLNPSRTEARTFLTADTAVAFLPMERVGTDGEIDEKMVSASDVWNGFTYFRRADVLVAKITPCFENGKGACLRALSTGIGFGSTEFHVLRAGSSISPQFLYRLTTLAPFRHSGAEAMTGAAGQQRVPKAFVANYPLPVPPPAEQAAIVRYLDHTDGRIRRYLRSRERLIELLKEYRQAVVHEAVTRGLDPDVPLKPSGVEWLGDVPTHWEVRRLKNICTKSGLYGVNISTLYYEESGVRFLRTTDITDDGQLKESGVFLHPDLVRDQMLDDGDILISRSGTVGRSFLYQADVHGPCSYAGYLVRFVLNSRALPKYVFLFTKTQAFEIFLRIMAISSTIENVNADKYANVHIPIPPLAEQAAIVAYLDKQTAAIDAAMARAQREIELLSEYRTRLIADVVTGQVDVREAAACLSDGRDPKTARAEYATD